MTFRAEKGASIDFQISHRMTIIINASHLFCLLFFFCNPIPSSVRVCVYALRLNLCKFRRLSFSVSVSKCLKMEKLNFLILQIIPLTVLSTSQCSSRYPIFSASHFRFFTTQQTYTKMILVTPLKKDFPLT